MIDKEKVNCTHSIMFHHFHDDKHRPAQGSLSITEFEDMLDWLSDKYNILNADAYFRSFEANKLKPKDICLSFDDALLCQFDIAEPILRSRNIKAFFFVHSSIFTGDPDLLEIFRYFRTTYFDNIDDFYNQFFDIVETENRALYILEYDKFPGLDYLASYPFYSDNDKWFRYLRDQVLGVEKYETLMLRMMHQKTFDKEEVSHLLWMTEDNLKNLFRAGHSIGLHSFSHPTQMSKLSRMEQEKQYLQNLENLESIIGTGFVNSMAHPCGDYNNDTLELLTQMNIKIGFRSSLSSRVIKSALEIPREDHANIFNEMKK